MKVKKSRLAPSWTAAAKLLFQTGHLLVRMEEGLPGAVVSVVTVF